MECLCLQEIFPDSRIGLGVPTMLSQGGPIHLSGQFSQLLHSLILSPARGHHAGPILTQQGLSQHPFDAFPGCLILNITLFASFTLQLKAAIRMKSP